MIEISVTVNMKIEKPIYILVCDGARERLINPDIFSGDATKCHDYVSST